MLLYVIITGLAFIAAWLYKLNRDYCVMAFFAKRLKTVDGTPLENIVPQAKAETIFANVFDCFGADNVALFENSRISATTLRKSYVEYGLFTTFYNIITAEDAELLLNDKNLITKGIAYYFLEPFLHTGLLTSTDKKWQTRRKLLTPAFHFNILGQFEEVFKEESQKFVDQLNSIDTNSITLNEIIPKFTLNSVCEAALGVKLDEQLDDQQYRGSFKMIEEAFIARIRNPFYMIDTIYNVFMAPKMEKHLKTVHGFSSNIIHKRRQLFAAELEHNATKEANEMDNSFGKKKRYAMLDTLLHAERNGLIDHAGICEEVDTFMFEGFDTTSMALIFTLMNLSLFPKMQEQCYQEILEYVDADLSNLDVNQLGKLKYLECFVKETLRLYPSVPGIMRKAIRDTYLANNVFLPADTQISIHIFDIHRNPKYFDEPNKFDPLRFTPENSEGRHPYAYIPFSAGQRNCIGQKFAMLEMKTLLVFILKKFKVLALMDPKDLQFETGIIIRTPNAVKVGLEKR
ncbi:probable cytochrome P450 4p3 [Rhagoletis pomonella]|uniref:probable cytochrome P450 4p3 n=1 Tax=Rhagoletis pomonella TaxID=28610 RepID=UPI001784C6F4|nr:probable cytochrome P450 4p3 [Rhagoletis pomonella]